MKVTSEPLVSIILVNYNGWQDTIECCESLLKLDYTNYNIVVVDNASTDNSVEFITAWAFGNLNYNFNQSDLSQKLAFPPTAKPINFIIQDAGSNTNKLEVLKTRQIALIKSPTNLGFAGGNNLGTKFMRGLSMQPIFYWYLNNDTVVEKSSLSNLVYTFKKHLNSGVQLGLLGSKLMYYHKPNTIQAVGALYNPWLATVKHVGNNEIDRGQFDNKYLDSLGLDYVVGASLFVSDVFLEKVGLMSEDYFLYYEEIDWIIRGKQKGFQFASCTKSTVYHKEGASTGANDNENIKSFLSDYYNVRNRLLITRKYYFWYLPIIYGSMFLVIINRIKRRQFSRIPFILRLLVCKDTIVHSKIS